MKLLFFERKLSYLFATVGGCGYSPYAPGTVGTLAGTIVFWLLRDWSICFFLLTTILFFFIGVYASQVVADGECCKDPSIVVIDEWVGVWLMLLFFLIYNDPLYLSISGYCFLFGLFRLFDITKPYPIKAVEGISGGFGIMLDDIIAAFYAIFLALILRFFYF